LPLLKYRKVWSFSAIWGCDRLPRRQFLILHPLLGEKCLLFTGSRYSSFYITRSAKLFPSSFSGFFVFLDLADNIPFIQTSEHPLFEWKAVKMQDRSIELKQTLCIRLLLCLTDQSNSPFVKCFICMRCFNKKNSFFRNVLECYLRRKPSRTIRKFNEEQWIHESRVGPSTNEQFSIQLSGLRFAISNCFEQQRIFFWSPSVSSIVWKHFGFSVWTNKIQNWAIPTSLNDMSQWSGSNRHCAFPPIGHVVATPVVFCGNAKESNCLTAAYLGTASRGSQKSIHIVWSLIGAHNCFIFSLGLSKSLIYRLDLHYQILLAMLAIVFEKTSMWYA